MSVIGELVVSNVRFRPIAMKSIKEIVKMCCPIAGAKQPKKQDGVLSEICVKYLKRWESLFGCDYPQIRYMIQAIPGDDAKVTVPNFEDVETSRQKAKVIFDIHNSELNDHEKDIQLAIRETTACVRLYQDSALPVSELVNLPLEMFTPETLRSVFGIDSATHGLDRSQAKSLLSGKLQENEKLLKQYEVMLSNIYQHTEFALMAFPSESEQYNGRAKFVRGRVVRLMKDCQQAMRLCEAVLEKK